MALTKCGFLSLPRKLVGTTAGTPDEQYQRSEGAEAAKTDCAAACGHWVIPVHLRLTLVMAG
ncbi:uncharacterized protein FOKN1_2784 [Thiohalobacter thiocyanaticus]|uniref:Uncharacterized protein n=1 Tax=Thiohalobacter thiocyanaticus TaxID=585455 RepID=A0A1Z4VVC3_9GAMM|nr:uncharacterized protein FOKN1_2784 [Thiohalobacter thiocyanaticus]